MEKDIKFEKTSSINVLDKQQAYDLCIEENRNFIAYEIIAHNTNRCLQYLVFNISNTSWNSSFLDSNNILANLNSHAVSNDKTVFKDIENDSKEIAVLDYVKTSGLILLMLPKKNDR